MLHGHDKLYTIPQEFVQLFVLQQLAQSIRTFPALLAEVGHPSYPLYPHVL